MSAMIKAGARGSEVGAGGATADVQQPQRGTNLWLWYDDQGWERGQVTSSSSSRFAVRTERLHGGSKSEFGMALPDDTISLAEDEPPAPPASVLPPPPTEQTEADAWRLLGRKRSRAAELPQPLALGAGFEVRAAGAAGVGLFALVGLPEGAVVTRYAGALRSLDDFKHIRRYAGARPYPDVNRGDHAARIPGTDWALDAWELARAAAAGALQPGDAWAARGLGGLVNSARGDAAKRRQNCRLAWHADVCLITTVAPVRPGDEFLAGYQWR